MGSGSIGIKLADNNFFPIIDDGMQGSKTLELTTVRENQDSVQIHLYRSKEKSGRQTIDSAEYIGTLTIEDIAENQAGNPTIRLKITISDTGDLSAEAIDADSGTQQTLNVSLRDLSKETVEPFQDFDITSFDPDAFNFSNFDDIGVEIEDYPDSGIDFDAEIHEETPVNASMDNSFFEDIDFSASDGQAETPDEAEERKGPLFPLWLCVLILVLGIAILAAGLVFAWRFFSVGSRAEQEAQAPVQVLPDVPEEEITPPPVWEENAVAVSIALEPPQIPEAPPEQQEARYLIAWGDTLWDIAETYYRNPWRYSYIAQYNGISNPNLIIAGTYILIPAE